MPTKITEQSCKEFLRSKTMNSKDEVYFKNPNTNRTVKESNPVVKQMIKDCHKFVRADINQMYVQQWIQNPYYDPVHKKRITSLVLDETAPYARMYKLAYEYFENDIMNPLDIQKQLPKEHVMFGNIDILFYKHLRNVSMQTSDAIFGDKEEIHSDIYRCIIKYSSLSEVRKDYKIPKTLPGKYTDNEKLYVFSLALHLCESIAKFISQVVYIHQHPTAKYKHNIDNYLEFIKTFNDTYHTHDLFLNIFNAIAKREITESIAPLNIKTFSKKHAYGTKT